MSDIIKKSMFFLIEASGYRNDFIAKKIGMSPAYFSVKKQRGNWSEKEVEKIMEVLTAQNEEVVNLLLLEQMRSLKKEETMSLATFKKQVGW